MVENITAAGLTRIEARVYTALLEAGRAQAGQISRLTGIHRRSVYDALERLIEKGLASWIKENDERFYLPEDPRQLATIVRAQQDEIDKVLPGLLAAYNSKHEKQETRFYKGVQGLRAVLEDQVREGKPVRIIGAARNANDILKHHLQQYTRQRVGKRLKLYLIYAGERRKTKVPFGTVRYLPESYATPVSTNVYGDRVAIIVWSEEPIVILIRNPSIAEAYGKYFELLWRIAEP
ncbi:TPA: hypothetical protein HA251_02310 [Candidatus Woesearchaeota archaeon]|nr:hypothetical protein [Candidatus Woesearchaeota archaeon]